MINNPANRAINIHVQEAKKEKIIINNTLERKPYTLLPPWTTTFNVDLTRNGIRKKKHNASCFIKNCSETNVLREQPNSEHTYTDVSRTTIAESDYCDYDKQTKQSRTDSVHKAHNIHSCEAIWQFTKPLK